MGGGDEGRDMHGGGDEERDMLVRGEDGDTRVGGGDEGRDMCGGGDGEQDMCVGGGDGERDVYWVVQGDIFSVRKRRDPEARGQVCREALQV